jgi:hypothetical protein
MSGLTWIARVRGVESMSETTITVIYDNPTDPETFEAAFGAEELETARRIPGYVRFEARTRPLPQLRARRLLQQAVCSGRVGPATNPTGNRQIRKRHSGSNAHALWCERAFK